VTPHPDDDAFKVCLRIRKDTIRRDVSGKCVGEKVPIASEFSPRVDAADDAALDPRYSGQRLSQSGVTIFSFEVDGSYVALAMHEVAADGTTRIRPCDYNGMRGPTPNL